MDKKNGIGYNNKLLWHLPKDLKWFKENTLNQTVVMGRNCYEDIITYTKGKPLPNRKNVILSKSLDPNKIHPDFLLFKTTEDLIERLQYEDKIFIIGGGQIYKQFINKADELIITEVNHTFEADVFFPKVDFSNFKKTYEQKESENNLDFTFFKYIKK